MSYALLPRSDDIDLESPPRTPQSPSSWVSFPKVWRHVRRSPEARLLLYGLLALGMLGLGWSHTSPSTINVLLGSVKSYPIHELTAHKLDYIAEDGPYVAPLQDALIARWPEDYPVAASYMQKNSIIRDTTDPWPEKPFIAKIWLSSDRFPEGLYGLPHDSTWLPEVGSAEARRPEPGLHDPPLPVFPASAASYTKLPKIPRIGIHQAKGRKPQVYRMRTPKPSRPVQAKSWRQNDPQQRLNQERRAWVRRGFLHAWEGYKAYAFGHDEVSPITRKFRDSYNAWGATTVDVLDTLLIMNLSHEYNVARTHVRSLDFSMLPTRAGCEGKEGPQVHLFETVIRYLGGLLSAYDLSGDQLMLDRAKDLGEWLLPAFGTSSGFPITFYQLGSNPAGRSAPVAIAAEVGSLSMELTRLSQLTGDMTFYNVAQRITDRFEAFKTPYGSLIATSVRADGMMWGDFTIGGMVDSYYEYLIKMTQLLGDSEGIYSDMYERAVEDLYSHLMINVTVTPDRSGIVIIGLRQKDSDLSANWQHLSTFAGGMFGLGSQLLARKQDLPTAAALTEAAIYAYQSTATGLMPEILNYHDPGQEARWEYVEKEDGLQARLRGNPLGSSGNMVPDYRGRPETIESIFYMYRITGDPAWQDHGWRIFTTWVKHAMTSTGFANVGDVMEESPPLVDLQESFVLAETFKYYYLLFSPPDFISLDDYVFNTEAHPFRVPGRPSSSLWEGPEVAVDQAYADPRDRHLFSSKADSTAIPFGRGTAQQQRYQAENCLSS